MPPDAPLREGAAGSGEGRADPSVLAAFHDYIKLMPLVAEANQMSQELKKVSEASPSFCGLHSFGTFLSVNRNNCKSICHCSCSFYCPTPFAFPSLPHRLAGREKRRWGEHEFGNAGRKRSIRVVVLYKYTNSGCHGVFKGMKSPRRENSSSVFIRNNEIDPKGNLDGL